MPKGNYIYFVDLSDGDKIYCLTHEVYKKNESMLKQRWGPYDVPNEVTIKAYHLEKVGYDQIYDHYDITSLIPIDFYVNRIKWIWIYYDPNP